MDSMVPSGGVYTLHVHAENGLGMGCVFASPLTQYKMLMQTLTQTQTLRVNRAL